MQKVHIPILHGAVISLWLVALPGFLIISIVSGIVYVMCLVVPAIACILILDSFGAILIGHWT